MFVTENDQREMKELNPNPVSAQIDFYYKHSSRSSCRGLFKTVSEISFGVADAEDNVRKSIILNFTLSRKGKTYTGMP